MNRKQLLEKAFQRGHLLTLKNPMYKNGKITTSGGYISIFYPDHPYSSKSGYIREHRLVMEKHIGRYLTPEEIVHHKGIKYPLLSIENRSDNRIESDAEVLILYLIS